MRGLWQKAPSCQLVIYTQFPGPDPPVKLILFPHLLRLLCLSAFIPALNLQPARCPAHFGTTVVWQRERRLVMCAGSTEKEMWHSSSSSSQTSSVIQLEKAPAVAGRQKESWRAARVSKSVHLMASSFSPFPLGIFPLLWPGARWTFKIADWQLLKSLLCMLFLS